MRFLLLVLSALGVNAQFDFGGGGGSGCDGSGSFQQQIKKDTRTLVGDVPKGLKGLKITLTSSADIDIQLTSGSTEVINWEGSIIKEEEQVTKTWSGDSITYSGYNGDGTDGGLGHEFVTFNDEISNDYEMYAYAYGSGFAIVTYSWTGKDGCTASGPNPSGSGSFTQNIAQGDVVVVGDLPIGLTDVYIRLESAADIDIQLYDGPTAVVKFKGGLISGTLFFEILCICKYVSDLLVF
jgi:hypothetical protein